MGICEKSHLGDFFKCVNIYRENGLWKEVGVLPVGVEECLGGFHRGCVDYFSRRFVPKWDNQNGESVLATAGTAPLLVELIGVAG